MLAMSSNLVITYRLLAVFLYRHWFLMFCWLKKLQQLNLGKFSFLAALTSQEQSEARKEKARLAKEKKLQCLG